MALPFEQGTQAGAIVAADAAETSAAAEATAVAAAATELVPLVLLKQKPSSRGRMTHDRIGEHAPPTQQELRDIEALHKEEMALNRKKQMRIQQARIARQQKLKHDLLHII